MLKRSHYIAVGVVILLSLILLNLPSHTTARLKLAFGSLFLPLFGLTNSADRLANKTGDVITTRGELLKENASLQRENDQLRMQLLQAQDTARENARLRQLVGWEQTKPWKLKLGKVVSRDPANWWRTVQIDLGSRDGLKENLPVLTMDGLVGRVSAVGLTRSTVVLIGDRNCKVAAEVVETRDTGVIGATDPWDNTLVAFGFLNKNAKLVPGQTVVTSGTGGFFPSGIPIGRIADSRQVDYGLSIEARVKLAANLSSLDEVWVLFPSNNL
ncbi:MAG TPA: rod shape-determining protein MreC [Candidatus Angelobacter sp.]|nr:rod shape-determining protein MreC [Candidatus Angelobacter sp.]